MRLFINLFMSVVLIVIVIEVGLFYVVPDNAQIIHAVSKKRLDDPALKVMPQWLVRAKLEVFGFRSCNLSLLSSDDTNVINFLVSSFDDRTYRGKIISLLERAVEQGCDINVPDHIGIPPLHAAVLFADITMVDVLIISGADASYRMKRPGKESDGMTAYEFSKLLLEKDESHSRSVIVKMLEKSK